MKGVTFKNDVQLYVGYLKFTHNMTEGIEYVLFDDFVEKLAAVKQAFTARDLPDELPLYHGEDLTGKTLIFTSTGGYGDALCFVQALNSLKTEYPSAQIDVAVNLDTYLFLRQFNFIGGWLNFPFPTHYLKVYDYFQTSESIRKLCRGDYDRANVARLFCELFSVPLDLGNSKYSMNVSDGPRSLNPSGKKRVAIQVDSKWGANRRYPFSRVRELALLLSEEGFEVYLVGFHKGSVGLNGNVGVFNLVNRLSAVTDLAVVISQMDVVVAPDSVCGHLGGMLGIPTIVVFSVTDIGKMDHYPAVYGMQSGLSCSPCFKVFKCPAGYDKCRALEDDSVSPEKILDLIGGIMV